MRKTIAAVSFLSVMLAGCSPVAWQTGLDTAATVVDTAAVVRAKQLGLCGEAPRQVVTSADAVKMQADIEELKRDLADAQRKLTEIAVERAKVEPIEP